MPFIYTDISGLWLWADPKLESYSNNDSVSGVIDWGASANHLSQATGAAQPTFKTNEVNSHPAFSFDAGDYLSKSSPAGVGAPSEFTVFAVIKRAGSGTRRTILYAGKGADQGPQILIDTNEKLRITKSQIEEVGASTASVSNSVYELWCVVLGSGAYTIYRNSVIDASGSYGNTFNYTGSPILNIGANVSASEKYQGYLALLLAYDTALSDADRQSVQTRINSDYVLYTIVTPLFSSSSLKGEYVVSDNIKGEYVISDSLEGEI